MAEMAVLAADAVGRFGLVVDGRAVVRIVNDVIGRGHSARLLNPQS